MGGVIELSTTGGDNGSESLQASDGGAALFQLHHPRTGGTELDRSIIENLDAL